MIKKWYAVYTQKVDSFINKISERYKKEPDNNEELKILIESIYPRAFLGINCNEHSQKVIDSQYLNIELYNKNLTDVIRFLTLNQTVAAYWCSDEPIEISVNDFFLTEKLFYLNEEQFVENFKSLALKYLELYRVCITIEDGVHMHNSRILNHFTKCIKKTTISLIELQST